MQKVGILTIVMAIWICIAFHNLVNVSCLTCLTAITCFKSFNTGDLKISFQILSFGAETKVIQLPAQSTIVNISNTTHF